MSGTYGAPWGSWQQWGPGRRQWGQSSQQGGWGEGQAPKGGKKAREVAEALRALQVEEGQRIDLAQPMPQTFAGSREAWDRAQANHQEAAKIKCLRTLAALASTEQEHSYYMGLVRQYRQKTADDLEPKARLTKAMEELAEARVTAQRARKHAEEANLALAKAESVQQAAQQELDAAREAAKGFVQPAAAEPAGASSAAAGGQSLARALEAIKAMAQVDQYGNMVMQASAFEAVAGAVAGAPASSSAAAAAPPSGGRRRRTSTCRGRRACRTRRRCFRRWLGAGPAETGPSHRPPAPPDQGPWEEAPEAPEGRAAPGHRVMREGCGMEFGETTGYGDGCTWPGDAWDDHTPGECALDGSELFHGWHGPPCHIEARGSGQWGPGATVRSCVCLATDAPSIGKEGHTLHIGEWLPDEVPGE